MQDVQELLDAQREQYEVEHDAHIATNLQLAAAEAIIERMDWWMRTVKPLEPYYSNYRKYPNLSDAEMMFSVSAIGDMVAELHPDNRKDASDDKG